MNWKTVTDKSGHPIEYELEPEGAALPEVFRALMSRILEDAYTRRDEIPWGAIQFEILAREGEGEEDGNLTGRFIDKQGKWFYGPTVSKYVVCHPDIALIRPPQVPDHLWQGMRDAWQRAQYADLCKELNREPLASLLQRAASVRPLRIRGIVDTQGVELLPGSPNPVPPSAPRPPRPEPANPLEPAYAARMSEFAAALLRAKPPEYRSIAWQIKAVGTGDERQIEHKSGCPANSPVLWNLPVPPEVHAAAGELVRSFEAEAGPFPGMMFAVQALEDGTWEWDAKRLK